MSVQNNASPLGQLLNLPCGATVPNRILKSAMTEGLADKYDRATQRHVNLYEAWSKGGTGIIVTGNVMVDRRFLERAGNIVVDNNGGETELAAVATAGQVAGTHIWAQISHPGRQCPKVVNPRPFSPSEEQLDMLGQFGQPRGMTVNDIEDAISRYAKTAAAVKAAGFNGLQIHAAHGYLISQFLSPHVNKRDDEWGGSLENRSRMLFRVIATVREAVGPEFPVAIKLNSSDFQKGAFTLEDSAAVVEKLNDAGIDLLEISGGTYEQIALLGDMGDTPPDAAQRESTRRREAYFLDYAKRIRDIAKMPLAVTGGFRDRQLMEEAIASGELDVIGLARPLCVDPDISNKLIQQTADRAPDPENTQLTFGAKSSGKLMRTLNNAAVYWFYRQIEHIADKQDTNPKHSHLGAIFWHFPRDLWRAFRRKRVLKAEGVELV